MKKSILYCVLLLLMSIPVLGQKRSVQNRPEYDDKPYHMGYTLGLNVMDFSFDRNYMSSNTPFPTVFIDMPSKTLGFQVGMIAEARLAEYLSVRALPSFIFGQRNLMFFEYVPPKQEPGKPIPEDSKWDKNNMNHIKTLKIESSMLDLPILLKYSAKRINNYRPYFVGGGSVRYDLASKSKFDDNEENWLLLKPLDFYAEIGFGIDFYLPYFKMATELKLSLGLTNVLNPELPRNPEKDSPEELEKNKYVQSLKSLTSNIIMISIHIE